MALPARKLLISIDEAAEMLGISRSHLYEIIRSDPTFPQVIKLGRASRIELAALVDWIRARSIIAAFA